jgi:hypothetical protein
VRNHILERLNAILAAKQVHLMAQIAQPFGGLEQVSFGPAAEIETLMNESNFHKVKNCRGSLHTESTSGRPKRSTTCQTSCGSTAILVFLRQPADRFHSASA